MKNTRSRRVRVHAGPREDPQKCKRYQLGNIFLRKDQESQYLLLNDVFFAFVGTAEKCKKTTFRIPQGLRPCLDEFRGFREPPKSRNSTEQACSLRGKRTITFFTFRTRGKSLRNSATLRRQVLTFSSISHVCVLSAPSRYF